ncbi:MAG: DUF6502 family protein [Proteobacteria bacterium]|nr:DUF6502 family protein [Pseudomonadota bacterium]
MSFDINWLDFIKNGLRPIIRILVKNKVEFNSFINLVRELFVEEAEQHINQTSNNNRGKISTIAFQTGLDRREVSRILKNRNSEALEDIRSREAIILEHWNSIPPFCSEYGKPKPLKRSGSGLSFEKLVQRFGKNISHGPILDALISANCVKINNNKLTLKNISYVPQKGASKEKIQIAADTLGHLGGTLNNNLSKNTTSIFQRSLYSIYIPKKHRQIFQKEITQMVTDFYLNVLTPKFDKIEAKYESSQKNNRAGISLFYFEDQ